MKIFNISAKAQAEDRSAALARLGIVARRSRDEASWYCAVEAADEDPQGSRPRRVFWTPDELAVEQPDG